MNILVLDVYPKKTYRISKDQNGAYGTANNYGKGFFCKVFKRLKSSFIQGIYVLIIIEKRVKLKN